MTFRFKMVFKVVRSNSKCIYNGFEFDHLDDVTQYYVHPDNQSPKHKTTLCQPVGEAVGLFSSMIHSVINVDRQTPFGNYWVSPAGDEYFLKIDVPEEYKENEVIEPQVFSYKAYLKGKNIVIAAYDENDSLIQAEMERDPGPYINFSRFYAFFLPAKWNRKSNITMKWKNTRVFLRPALL